MQQYDDVDGFNEETEKDLFEHLEEKVIHVRKQKRKGRKWLTTLENVPSEDSQDILKALRKKLCCNGSVVPGDRARIDVIQLQGDHSAHVGDVVEEYLPEHNLFYHG